MGTAVVLVVDLSQTVCGSRLKCVFFSRREDTHSGACSPIELELRVQLIPRRDTKNARNLPPNLIKPTDNPDNPPRQHQIEPSVLGAQRGAQPGLDNTGRDDPPGKEGPLGGERVSLREPEGGGVQAQQRGGLDDRGGGGGQAQVGLDLVWPETV